jgi:beta-glucosidase
MFDPPSMVKYAKADSTELESAPHKAHALKMARQSIVLLRNENNLLPLSKNLKKIAVFGPNADNENVLLGNYNGTPSHITTVLQGIKEKAGRQTQIIYERAIDYALDTMKEDGIKKLNDADAIIFIGGITSQLEGEALQVDVPGFKGGDRTSIMLPAVQTNFLKKLKETGKPVVFVMMTGSALAIPWEAQNIPAIINAWYGGQSGGTAVADVIFGDYNPAGRLPVTFYKSDADLPPISDYDMSNRTYRYFGGDVLYPFGYGLSYSEFQYSNLKTAGNKLITVSVDITNKSKRDGDEVAELYISHPDAVKKPIRALKGFQRIFIKAGDTRHISFTLDQDALSLVNEKGESYLPKGKLVISVGGGQPGQKLKATSNVLVKTIDIK